MTPALRIRITTFAVLIVISFAVIAPSVYSPMDTGKRGQDSSDATGMQPAGQTTSLAPAENAALQYVFLDDSFVMNAFDTQEEYSTHARGIHNADSVIGFATTAVDAALPHASLDNSGARAPRGTPGRDGSPAPGAHHAGQMADSAPTAAGAPQHASRQDGGGTTDMAQQPKDAVPATGSDEAGPLVNLASPATGSPNTTPVGTIAKAGEDDGLDPFIDGKPKLTDLIDPPDGVVEPTAGGSAPGSNPAADCGSNSTCQAQLPKAINAVPEPGSIALLGLGMIALVLSRRRKAAMARQ